MLFPAYTVDELDTLLTSAQEMTTVLTSLPYPVTSVLDVLLLPPETISSRCTAGSILARMLAVCWPYVSRMLAACWPYVGRMLAVYWSFLAQNEDIFVVCMAGCWPYVGRMLAVC